jgi:hypothetical protein
MRRLQHAALYCVTLCWLGCIGGDPPPRHSGNPRHDVARWRDVYTPPPPDVSAIRGRKVGPDEPPSSPGQPSSNDLCLLSLAALALVIAAALCLVRRAKPPATIDVVRKARGDMLAMRTALEGEATAVPAPAAVVNRYPGD